MKLTNMGTINKFFIRNTDTKQDIVEFNENLTISPKILSKNWNIRIDANCQSIIINVNGKSNIENLEPYCYPNDTIPLNLPLGEHTIIAIPCDEKNGQKPGTPIQTKLKINFNQTEIIEQLNVDNKTLIINDSKKTFGNQTINFSYNSQNAYPCIYDNGTDNVFKNIVFNGDESSVLLIPKEGIRNSKLLNCEMKKGGSLFQGTNGVENYIIENCGANFPIKKLGLFYLGGSINPNKNIKFINCYSVGSINEHVLRVHNTIGLECNNCNFQNPSDAVWAVKKGACFNLRDGENFNIINCKGSGQFLIGPLADNNGGLNDPNGPEKDRKLNLRLKNVIIDNFNINKGYFIIESGTENITFKNITGTIDGGGGYFLSFQKQYGPRPIPTNITIENCDLTGGKEPFAGRANNLIIKNFKWNGKNITSVWNGKPI